MTSARLCVLTNMYYGGGCSNQVSRAQRRTDGSGLGSEYLTYSVIDLSCVLLVVAISVCY